MNILLGIDPGYDRCGWGVLAVEGVQQKPVAFDCVLTKRTETKYQRFAQIIQELDSYIKKYKVEEIAMEELFFSRNVNTAMPVSEVRGMVFALAIQNNIPVFEYKPNEIKQTVTGYGRADKSQVLTMVQKQLRLDKIPKIDDTGDALAVALTHAIHRRSRLK